MARLCPSGGEFDSFVIEVTNLDNFAESQNLTLSGDALSLGISGLNPNTSYMVGLYGMYQGSFLEPVYTEATTGTCNLQCCKLHFLLRVYVLLNLTLIICMIRSCSICMKSCSLVTFLHLNQHLILKLTGHWV
uniref:Fibronectin type-III domain-containing protein n=1 Tax=Acanthochromis polyacanthus TaxID=80966 RepID=A0A3Q1F195_9TELE